MTGDDEWWWCLDHKAAERADGCPPDRRLGPYPSREAAEHWKERVDARNEAWDAEDAEWDGES